MNKTLFFSVFVVFLAVTSCKKAYMCDEGKGDYTCGTCDLTDKSFEDFYTVEDGMTQYVIEPIVVDADCGYIVSGYVKYVKDGKTAALVHYGNGEVDALATKKIYSYDKDGKGGQCGFGDKNKGYKENIKVCEFEQVCSSSNNGTASVANIVTSSK